MATDRAVTPAQAARRLRTRALAGTIVAAPGDLEPGVREAVVRRARMRTLGAGGPLAGLPEALARFADKVTSHAYAVVDADVDALRAAGYSEDAVFEAVVSVAVGAGLARLEAGLA